MRGLIPVDPLGIYQAANRLAMERGQVVGEKNDYYVTLEQLERLLTTPPSKLTISKPDRG
jgi:hypothetical protein